MARKSGGAAPALSAREFLAWSWRQLTSMRVALFLLLLLAVAAVPGSLFPQRPAGPPVVTQYIQDNPVVGPWLDRLQMFDVFSSVWFSAIYLLLFVSLIGCIVPRVLAHARALRSTPPRTPARLSRLPQHRSFPVSAPVGLEAVARTLRAQGYRVDTRHEGPGQGSVAAEKGHLKEAGNLVFHTSLIGVLISVAVGSLWGFSGQKALVVGSTFVNTLSSYDSFTPGSYFSDGRLEPYAITLDDFEVRYDVESTTHLGQPLDFTATLTTRPGPDAEPEKKVLKVNEPLSIGGTSIYLVGNGYAPVVTVRDGEGRVALSEPVISLANDSMNTSTTVIKVPDAQPEQLAFVGFFLPTTVTGEDGISFSRFPDLYSPTLTLDSYWGNLGLDEGTPQNVYVLDRENLTQLNGRKLPAGGIVLKPGETHTLPDGKGSITLEGVVRYIGVDIRDDPGQAGALVFSALGLSGLAVSLFLPRRRAWVRLSPAGTGGTSVELGLLARGEDFRLAAEADRIAESIAALDPAPGDSTGPTAETSSSTRQEAANPTAPKEHA